MTDLADKGGVKPLNTAEKDVDYGDFCPSCNGTKGDWNGKCSYCEKYANVNLTAEQKKELADLTLNFVKSEKSIMEVEQKLYDEVQQRDYNIEQIDLFQERHGITDEQMKLLSAEIIDDDDRIQAIICSDEENELEDFLRGLPR